MRPTSLLTTLVVSLAFSGCGVSSDSTLEKLFRSHEKEFEELRSISIRSGVTLRATTKGIRSSKRFPDLKGRLPDEVLDDRMKKMSESDWRTFRKLMRDLSIDAVFIDRPGNSVAFRVDRNSLLNGDSEKGIIYSESPLTPLVSKLDHYRAPPDQLDLHGGFTAYKVLRANWYLYFEQ